MSCFRRAFRTLVVPAAVVAALGAAPVPAQPAFTTVAIWEASQYKFMHEASCAWLDSTRFRGSEEGRCTVGFGGVAP